MIGRSSIVGIPLGGVILASIVALSAGACGDCELRQVEARLDWVFVATGEGGANFGTVGVGNLTDYATLERTVLHPAKSSGRLLGFMGTRLHGRLRSASIALTFPLAEGDVIVGKGFGSGGWGLFPPGFGAEYEQGVRLWFEPPLHPGAESSTIKQKLEVVGLSPLRLLLTWAHEAAGQTTALTGEITLTRTIQPAVCN